MIINWSEIFRKYSQDTILTLSFCLKNEYFVILIVEFFKHNIPYFWLLVYNNMIQKIYGQAKFRGTPPWSKSHNRTKPTTRIIIIMSALSNSRNSKKSMSNQYSTSWYVITKDIIAKMINLPFARCSYNMNRFMRTFFRQFIILWVHWWSQYGDGHNMSADFYCQM